MPFPNPFADSYASEIIGNVADWLKNPPQQPVRGFTGPSTTSGQTASTARTSSSGRASGGSFGEPVAPAQQQSIPAAIAAEFEAQFPGLIFVGIDPGSGNIVARDNEGKTAVFAKQGATYVRVAGGTADPKFGVSDGGGRQFAPQAISAEVDPVTGEVLWIDPNTRSIQRSGQFIGIEPKQIIDPRSGRLLVVTPDGKVTDTGSQVGFADIDPEREFVEGQRQFDEGERGATERTRINDTGATTRTQMTEAGNNQRAGLTAQVQGFQSINQLAPQLATAAVNNAEFTRDTLRQPQDYVARAHFQRGATSPLPEVSQADVINKLRSNISGFNETLAGFQGFNPVVAAPPATAPVQAAAAVAPPAAAPAPPSALDAQGNLSADAIRRGAVWRPTPGFAGGGFTTAPMFVVGDSTSGQPTGFEETVINPTQAPIAIKPSATPRVPGFASGTGWLGALNAAQEAMNDPVKQAEIVNAANASAWSGNAGFASTQADDWDDDYSPAPPPPPPPPPVTTLAPPSVTAQPAPFQFQPPQLPVAAPVTQDELRATERSVRPPGVNDVLSGRMPSPLRFKRPLFTPMQWGALTTDEQTATATSLALDNESIDDYKTGMMQRFVAPQTRGRAAFVGGFAA